MVTIMATVHAGLWESADTTQLQNTKTSSIGPGKGHKHVGLGLPRQN